MTSRLCLRLGHARRGAIDPVIRRGRQPRHYLRDRKLQLAVERALEIIGEAARLISSSLKARDPEIPWSQIVAQRNVLAHEYGEIKQDRIWRVATSRIPELNGQLEPLLPPAAPETGGERSE